MKKILVYLFSLLYSNLSTCYENLFFKNKKIFSELIKVGFYKDKLKLKSNCDGFIEKKSSQNNFSEKLIIKEEYINQIIDKGMLDLGSFEYAL